MGVGDRVILSVSAYGEPRNIEFVVEGLIRYFPTYYPDDPGSGYLFVCNLDFAFEQLGGVFPYDVWITADPEADPQRMQDEMHSRDFRVLHMNGSRQAIEKEQSRPERTGVFGILTVGFVAAVFLTMLGFLLHSFISFRRRFVEFSVLRAIGLSVGQMIGLLGIEQLVLVGAGITAGAGLGVWVSDRFIPFLQVGTARHFDIPCFVVLIAWDDVIRIYVIFGVMLAIAIAGMIWLLIRMRVFEAVKLGEAD